MAEREHEMRDRLARTWKALVARLADYDFPPHVVFETLAAVAADGMMDSYGPSATAHMLRLRADAIEAEEDDRVRDLLAGDGDGPPASTGPIVPMPPIRTAAGFEPWPDRAADQAAAVDLIGR